LPCFDAAPQFYASPNTQFTAFLRLNNGDRIRNPPRRQSHLYGGQLAVSDISG
jgi:hypothetical protein